MNISTNNNKKATNDCKKTTVSPQNVCYPKALAKNKSIFLHIEEKQDNAENTGGSDYQNTEAL